MAEGPRPLRPYIDRLLQASAVLLWLVILVLSLLPGSERPHTGYSGNLEHVAAYLGTGAVTALAFPSVSRLRLASAFALASCLFEILQIVIPGRSPGVDNWASSSIGALAGIFAARALLGPLMRRLRRQDS